MGDGRTLLELSAALGAGDRRAVEAALAAAGEERLAGREVEEALLQAYLFVGFPPVLRAMAVWRAGCGAEPPAASEEARTDRAVWRRRGEALCRRVYGSAYEKLRARVRRLHPALDRWMVEEGYGKVLSRSGLDPVRRELCVVALLAAAGHLPQLHSHLRGALHLGAPPDAVSSALEVGLTRAASVEDAAAARRLWGEVRRRATGGTA